MQKFIICLTIILFSIHAHAYRCGQKLISTGAYFNYVIKKCGEPDSKEHYNKEECSWNSIANVRHCTQVQVDILTYVRSGMTNRMLFHNKKLKEIKSCREC